jgi:hypothetical protein
MSSLLSTETPQEQDNRLPCSCQALIHIQLSGLLALACTASHSVYCGVCLLLQGRKLAASQTASKRELDTYAQKQQQLQDSIAQVGAAPCAYAQTGM